MIHLALSALALATPTTRPMAPPLARAVQDPAPMSRQFEIVVLERGSRDLFPAASGDLVVVAGEGEADWTVLRLLEEYAVLTGQQLQLDQDTRQVLEQLPTGLTRNASIAAAQVQGFVERLLVQCSCILEPVRGASPPMVGVRSLHTSARNAARMRAIHVPEDELAAWAEHPAVLITTSVRLPHTDVRQLSNSMRTLIVDANIQQVLPAGNTSSMVLAGLGPWVIDFARLLHEADEAARLDAPAPQVERFALQFAEAAAVAAALEELTGGPLPSDVTHAPGQHPGEVRVLTDVRTNALVVVATPDAMPVVRRAIELLDVES